jgi:hypothetical protein
MESVESLEIIIVSQLRHRYSYASRWSPGNNHEITERLENTARELIPFQRKRNEVAENERANSQVTTQIIRNIIGETESECR